MLCTTTFSCPDSLKRGLDVMGKACYIIFHAKVAQSVEHSTENAGVASSILALGTFYVPQPAKVALELTLAGCVFVLLPLV